MIPLCWMRSAFVLVAHLAFAEGVVTCSSSDLQRVLGDYSAICSGFFSDAFSLTSELGNYVHLLNLTAVQLSTAVRSIQQVLLIFSYWNFKYISNIFQIYFSFSLHWGAPTWIPTVFQTPKSQSFPIRQALSLVRVSLWPFPGQMLLAPSLLSYSLSPFWLFASAQAGQGDCPIAWACR